MKMQFNPMPALLVFLFIAFLQSNLSAQMVGLTTNPFNWKDQRPNLGLQLSYPKFSWVAAYGEVTLAKSVFQTEQVNSVFAGRTIALEARFFPFGGRSHLRAGRLDEVTFFKRKGKGCYQFAAKKRPAPSWEGGLYLAPGVEVQRFDLTNTARIYEQDLTTRYEFRSTGMSLHLGYQLSFEHITIGASYGFYATKPTVQSSVADIPDELQPKTNVWGIRSKQGLRLSVGVSF